MDIYMWDTLVTDIYMWWPDYSAIQWPCDSGFHIPTTAEWQALLSAVWTTASNYFNYLHIPKSWYLARATWQIITTYWYCRYWTCNMTANTKADARWIDDSNSVQMFLEDKPANGYPIRAFKDAPVTPDSSWTETLSWKIWYNSTLWLISIKDGSDYITIQDKNVWATTVYNNNDTVTNDNAGWFFQFWNNNWFPYTWATSSYTTTQTVSWYWPWNYYSDSHFVKVSSNNWFTGTNNNIWGWETGVVAPSEIQEVYEWATKIWPTVVPFTPTASTIWRYPLDWDLKDYSWNNRDLTWTSVNFTSWWPWQVWVFTNSSNAYYQNNSLFCISYPFTWLVWVSTDSVPTWYRSGAWYYENLVIDICNGTDYNTQDKWLWFWNWWFIAHNYDWAVQQCYWGTASANTWYSLAYSFDGSTMRVYANGTLINTLSSSWSYTWFNNARVTIPNQSWANNLSKFSWKISNVILENRVWTAQEISDYFNASKSMYWVS